MCKSIRVLFEKELGNTQSNIDILDGLINARKEIAGESQEMDDITQEYILQKKLLEIISDYVSENIDGVLKRDCNAAITELLNDGINNTEEICKRTGLNEVEYKDALADILTSYHKAYCCLLNINTMCELLE